MVAVLRSALADTERGLGDLPLTVAMRSWRTLAVAPRHEPWTFHHPRLRFLRSSMTDLDLPAETFDLVVARSLAQTQQVMPWLKPGGRLLFTSTTRQGGVTCAWRQGGDGKWRVSSEGGELFAGTVVKDKP